MFPDVNYLAIGVAAVAHFVIGAIWYGALFSKMWLGFVDPDGTKMEKLKEGQAMAFIGSFVGSLFMSYVVARLLVLINFAGLMESLVLGFLVWFGFTVPMGLNDVGYEKKPFGLFMLNTLYYLIGVLVATVILFYWK